MTGRHHTGVRYMDIANHYEDMNSEFILVCVNIPYEHWRNWRMLINHLNVVYERYSEYFEIDYQEYLNFSLELLLNHELTYHFNPDHGNGLIDLLSYKESEQDRVEQLLDENLMYLENDFFEYYTDYFYNLLVRKRDYKDEIYDDYNEAQMMSEIIDPIWFYHCTDENGVRTDVIDFILGSIQDVPGTYRYITDMDTFQVEDCVSFSLNLINVERVDAKRGNIAVRINQKSNTI